MYSLVPRQGRIWESQRGGGGGGGGQTGSILGRSRDGYLDGAELPGKRRHGDVILREEAEVAIGVSLQKADVLLDKLLVVEGIHRLDGHHVAHTRSGKLEVGEGEGGRGGGGMK